MTAQKTIQKEIKLKGIGLHSGRPARVTLRPAAAGRGIVFIRKDLDGAPEISAHYKNVVNTQLATTLGRGQIGVSTVEHLLAALQGMGVDNCLVEVEGPELPIMDGSSISFCEAIQKAGVETQDRAKPYLALRRKVEVKIGEKWALAEPSSRFEIHGSIEWDHPAIGYQEFHYTEGKTDFAKELASARTFGFLKDVEAMQKVGLARGGSLDNAVVLDQASVLNPDGLRYADEFVRHKVLDALGDFKLAGIALQCFIRLHRAGHDLHSQLLMEIFKNPDNFEIIDGATEERKPARVRTAIAAASFAATF